MKLYYSPGACSMASHIALVEAGLDYSLQKVDLKTHTFDGQDFSKINPKNHVPALQLNDGQVLTENAVVLQYIADSAKNTKLIPKAGEFDRYRAEEWLNFIATDLHKGFAPFHDPTSGDDVKKKAAEGLMKAFKIAANTLAHQSFLMGETCSVADSYFFVMMTWAHKFKLDLKSMPSLEKFFLTMKQRPAVQKAMAEEGLH